MNMTIFAVLIGIALAGMVSAYLYFGYRTYRAQQRLSEYTTEHIKWLTQYTTWETVVARANNLQDREFWVLGLPDKSTGELFAFGVRIWWDMDGLTVAFPAGSSFWGDYMVSLNEEDSTRLRVRLIAEWPEIFPPVARRTPVFKDVDAVIAHYRTLRNAQGAKP